MPVNDPTLSRPILEMAAIASEYCILIEKVKAGDQEAFLKSLKGFIPLLYLRGSLLTASEPEFPEANERYVTEEQWEVVFLNLRNLFGKLDEFWLVDYNETSHYDPVKASISECLTDIYQDLKDFVILYKKSNLASRENAIFSCQSLFHDHWGLRMAQLLPYLHTISFEPAKQNEIGFFDLNL
jgi:hypothetical protein